MSTIVKTEAIVLKTLKYRESSVIVTLYTKEFGKVKAIAKGARQPKSKFGASLQLMSYVVAVLYKKETREIQLLSQCDLMKSFRWLSEDLQKMAVGLSAIELMDKVSHDEEPNEALFGLITETLSVTNAALKNPWNVFYAFEIRLAGILGFHPNFERCVECGIMMVGRNGLKQHVLFQMGKGGPVCSKCAPSARLAVQLTAQALAILHQLAKITKLDAATSIEIGDNVRREIEGVLLGFLRYHVAGLHGLKSEKVFSTILS